jgi:hypothetical protein
MICNECETVAHCLKNGCVPKQPPAPVQQSRSDVEPVARVHTFIGPEWAVVQVLGEFNLEDEIYTAAQRQWVGLTPEQKLDMATDHYADEWAVNKAVQMLEEHERQLQEKNT